jgi:alkylation response protein AidB-like acyl-CoA dehydrogenase
MSTLAARPTGATLGPEISIVPDADPMRVELRAWLDEHVPSEPEPLDLDERIAFRREWQRTMSQGGWAGPAWPERYGGRGAGPLEQFMYYEELALARAPEPVNTPGIVLLGPTLMVYGDDELKDRFLPGILSGDELWCQGFSEPESGSDLASLKTTARLEDGEWVIDGQKIWTTFAPFADFAFVLCRTEPGSSRHRGLTLLICPIDQPGVRVQPILQMSGESEFAQVFFSSARTPEAWVVGEPGHGWAASMTLFGFERADQGLTDHALLLVRLGDLAEPIRRARLEGAWTAARLERARSRYVELWMRAQQLRRLNLRTAVRVQAGEEIGASSSLTTVLWSEIEKGIAEFAVELEGPEGLIAQRQVSYGLLASRAASIYSGTNEIQRNIIAERLLGLPR